MMIGNPRLDTDTMSEGEKSVLLDQDVSNASLHMPIIIEEYRALWTYYIRTLDERHKVIEYYFRSVTIPASLIGLLTLLGPGSAFGDSVSSQVSIRESAAALLAVVFLVGVSLYVYYVRETSNSKRYTAALKHIRNRMKAESKWLNDMLSLDQQKIRTDTLGSEMPLWRAGPMIVINSAVGSVSILIFLQISDSLAFVSFCILALLHILFWAASPKSPIWERERTTP